MPLILTTILILLFSGSLCEEEKRKITDTLTVKNGGPWGDWGKEEYCPTGYIKGLSLKLQKDPKERDQTGIIGITGYCSDGSDVKSSVGEKEGSWSAEISCTADYLVSFSLRVQRPQGKVKDDTAVNNIKFKCGDGTEHEGNGTELGKFGAWSKACNKGKICGIQTKVEISSVLNYFDRTELNDVKFFCCK